MSGGLVHPTSWIPTSNNNTITRGRRRMPGQHGSSELDANHRLVLAVKRMTWIKGKHHPRQTTCAKSRSVTLALAGLKLDNTFKLQRWIVTEQWVKVLDDVSDVQQHKYTAVEWVSLRAWPAGHNWWLKILWQVFLALAGLKFELKKKVFIFFRIIWKLNWKSRRINVWWAGSSNQLDSYQYNRYYSTYVDNL